MSGTFVTHQLSYDTKIKSHGLGMFIMHDIEGVAITTTNYSLSYAKHLKIGEFELSLGAQPTLFRKCLDWSKLTFGDMVDPRYGFIYKSSEIPGETSIIGFDMNTGLNLKYKTFYSGFAVHHVFEPNTSVLGGSAPLPRKYTLYVSRELDQDFSSLRLIPIAIYQQQQNFTQLILGTSVQYKRFVGTVKYRNQDAFILGAGYRSKTFNFSYSYDNTISKLSTSTGGSHELMLGWNFARPWDKKE